MERKEQLGQIVGNNYVFDDEGTLEEYGSDFSFVKQRRPSYVVKPKKTKEVQDLVGWANKTGTPLVPVSSSPPRFRGDTIPALGGEVVVDLSRMNKINMVDRKDRVAMVEPGVRFGELQEALEKKGLKMPMPLCPRSTKSVIGSWLERDPHIVPKHHLDNSDPLLCTEVIFGTGDLFKTGEAAGPGTVAQQQKAGRRQKNPYGVQTDLVRIIQGAQGSMGIVTWATLRCELLPKVQKPFLVPSEDVGKLIEFSYRLVRLRLGDDLFLLNNNNMASLLGDNPEEIDRRRKKLPRWTLFYCLAGYETLPEERIEYQEKDITDIAKEIGLTPSPESVPGVGARELLETVRKPSREPFWKIRHKGACQEILFISSFHDIPKFIDTMYEVAGKKEHTSPIGMYIQPVNQGHGYHCEFDLFYNTENPGETEKVKEVYFSATELLLKRGAFFSRPYGHLAEMVFNRDAATKQALKKVKGIFDPNDIMNTGKLI